MTTKTHEALCPCRDCQDPSEVDMTYEFRMEWNKKPRYEIYCLICGRSTDYYKNEDDCIAAWEKMNLGE